MIFLRNLPACFFPEENARTRIVIATCYAVIGLIALLIFTENFIFSSSTALLGFREIDDLAFQITLRNMHSSMSNGTFSILARANDYAYGLIFWGPLAILTYPLWWVSTHFSIDWPLIVLPRQIQLALALGGLYLLGRVLKRLEAQEWCIAVTLLCMALFPSFDYFSMRFGTVNSLFFFSILSFYLALEDTPSTPRGRIKVALSLAVAGGIKLSGLLIAPPVVLLVLARMPTRDWRSLMRAVVNPSLVFFVGLITFTFPKLWLSPLHPSIAVKYFENLSHFIEVTKASHGESFFALFYQGIFLHSLLVLGAFGLLFTGLLLWIYDEKEKRSDGASIVVGILIAVAYLLIAVHSPSSIAVYFCPVSFLLFIGIRGFQKIRFGPIVIVAVLLLFAGEDILRSPLYNNNPLHWGLFSYFIKEREAQADLQESAKVLACLEGDLKGRAFHHVFVDFTLPLTVNAMTNPDACISVAYNNLAASGKYCGTLLDYLILDRKNAIGFKPESEFRQIISKADPNTAQTYKTDRDSRISIETMGTFAGQTFQPLCRTDKTSIYRAVSP